MRNRIAQTLLKSVPIIRTGKVSRDPCRFSGSRTFSAHRFRSSLFPGSGRPLEEERAAHSISSRDRENLALEDRPSPPCAPQTMGVGVVPARSVSRYRRISSRIGSMVAVGRCPGDARSVGAGLNEGRPS